MHGRITGFLVLGGRAHELREIDIRVTRRNQALGLYRWPQSWRASFVAEGRIYHLDVALAERKSVANWVIGDFAMGIARGELRCGSTALAS